MTTTTTAATTAPTSSFKSAYGILQKHATSLRTQSEPNIDELLQVVTESVKAHDECQRRIDMVEKALNEALGTQTQPVAG